MLSVVAVPLNNCGHKMNFVLGIMQVNYDFFNQHFCLSSYSSTLLWKDL